MALPMLNNSDSRTNSVPGPTPFLTTTYHYYNALNDTRLWLGVGLVIGVPLMGIGAWKLGRRIYTFWSASRVHFDVPHVVV